MKKRGILPMVLLCAMLLLLVPQAASAKSHWSFYAGVTPVYTYPYPYYFGSPYYAPYSGYYYNPPYSPYYYMYPRHEWGHGWHESHEHHHHH
jgi:hypothetical protein